MQKKVNISFVVIILIFVFLVGASFGVVHEKNEVIQEMESDLMDVRHELYIRNDQLKQIYANQEREKWMQKWENGDGEYE